MSITAMLSFGCALGSLTFHTIAEFAKYNSKLEFLSDKAYLFLLLASAIIILGYPIELLLT